jgi:hypothetical protein
MSLGTHFWTTATLGFSLVATMTWIAHAFNTDGLAFSVVSNGAFAVDVLLIPIATQKYLLNTHPMIYATTFASALLAGGSFAHHIDRQQGDPAHTLDIAMGWVLYWHLALTAAYSYVHSLTHWKQLLVLTSVVEAVGLIAMFSFYSQVRRDQQLYLIAFGCISHGCTIAHRFRRGMGVCDALGDFIAVVALQAGAAVLQGQLWVSARSSARYNVEHGYWHIINATIVGVLILETCQLVDLETIPAIHDKLSRNSLVVFVAFLVALTLINDTGTVWTWPIVCGQAALLGVSVYAIAQQRTAVSLGNRPESAV